MKGSDLVRIAELIKLAAETAMSLRGPTTNGEFSTIAEIAARIDAAAAELADVGRALERRTSAV